MSGWAVEHALTRTVRDGAALLDATSGPDVGDPYWAPPPARPFLSEIGADPGHLRIGFSEFTPDGVKGHPHCLDALDDAIALCTSLGHDVVEAELPGLTPETGAAIGTVFDAATAWIIQYWIRRVGREPGPHEIEPASRAYWESGKRRSAAVYLEAIEHLQRFTRGVARFLTTIDVWLTPTMSTPPLPLGSSYEEGQASVRYPAVVANITGNPAMSVPLWWNKVGLPIGVHFLGRFGDEATLFSTRRTTRASPPVGWTRATNYDHP